MGIEIPATTAHAPSNLVASALSRAAAKTGIDFDYLMRAAKRESALDPRAKAATSTAAGLFQFIEQTWLGAVKNHGARHGMSDFADDITRNSGGRFVVGTGARRREILDLRFDPQKAATLAGELARENKVHLEKQLGRVVGAADLYAAHFLGPNGAIKLLKAAPAAAAAEILPAAAGANRNVFFDGVREKTVAEVLASIGRSMGPPADPKPVLSAANGIGSASANTGLPTLRDGPGPPAVQSAVTQERWPAPAEIFTKEIPADARRASWHFSLDTLFSPAKLLSPLALAVLQALDPTKLISEKTNDRR